MNHSGVKLRIEDTLFTVLYNRDFYNTDSESACFPHKHYLFEAHYITGGEGHLYLENGRLRVTPGQCILISPGTVHFFRADPGRLIERFDILFDAEVQRGSPNAAATAAILRNVGVSHWRDEALLPLYAARIKEELAARGYAFQTAVSSLLTLLLLSLLRNAGAGELPDTADDATRYDMNVKTFTVIESFFARHYAEPVSPALLAEELSVSPRQLNRILRRYFGMSFQEKLIRVRMDVARNLLRQTDLPVACIAERVGYGFDSSFCNQFYKKTGGWPAQYRRDAAAAEKKGFSCVIREEA